MNRFNFGLVLLFIWSLVACSFSPTQMPQELTSASNLSQTQDFNQRLLAKPAYKGPVKIEINTTLLNPEASQTKKYDLTHFFQQESGFRTQAVPSGPIVFQETFIKSGIRPKKPVRF